MGRDTPSESDLFISRLRPSTKGKARAVPVSPTVSEMGGEYETDSTDIFNRPVAKSGSLLDQLASSVLPSSRLRSPLPDDISDDVVPESQVQPHALPSLPSPGPSSLPLQLARSTQRSPSKKSPSKANPATRYIFDGVFVPTAASLGIVRVVSRIKSALVTPSPKRRVLASAQAGRPDVFDAEAPVTGTNFVGPASHAKGGGKGKGKGTANTVRAKSVAAVKKKVSFSESLVGIRPGSVPPSPSRSLRDVIVVGSGKPFFIPSQDRRLAF